MAQGITGAKTSSTAKYNFNSADQHKRRARGMAPILLYKEKTYISKIALKVS